jgi:hypothetical protein
VTDYSLFVTELAPAVESSLFEFGSWRSPSGLLLWAREREADVGHRQ